MHIADNVVDAGHYRFLTTDGTLWMWDENNPTPQPTLENVAALGDSRMIMISRAFIGDGHVHFYDGSVFFVRRIPSGANEQIIENVQIPSTIEFSGFGL